MCEKPQKCDPFFQIFETMEKQGEIARMVLFRQARARECSQKVQESGHKVGVVQMREVVHWPGQLARPLMPMRSFGHTWRTAT